MMWNRLHTSAPANISFSLYHSCDNLGQLCPNCRSAGLGSRPGVDLMCFIIFRRAALDYIIVIRGCWRRRKSRWSILLEIPAQKTGALSYLPTPHWSEHATWLYPSSNRRKIYPSSLSCCTFVGFWHRRAWGIVQMVSFLAAEVQITQLVLVSTIL